MNKEQILENLKSKKEMIPDEHDGSYELMREIISSYLAAGNIDKCTYLDLNAIYAMTIGTWRMNIEKKKEYIAKSCLPVTEKDRLGVILDKVWDNACRGKYENRNSDEKPSIGMFGSGFFSFENKTSDDDAKAFIKMLIDISALSNDDDMFDCAAEVIDKPIKGLQAASVSVILHCLKPMTFPILNSNAGNGTIFEVLGIDIDKAKESSTYISNCRKIKKYREDNFSFKNYRILDKAAWLLDNQKIADNDGGIAASEKIFDKNVILYGPPGTGKTYNTVIYAVAIIEGKSIESVRQEAITDAGAGYQLVKKRYEEYKANGQIAFTTFHQSYGYEDFIEGIRPNMSEEDESDLEYKVEAGIFKKFCEIAKRPSKNDDDDYGLNKSPAVWKVSLGHTYENPTRTECLENNHIRIGWDKYGENLPEGEYTYGGKAVLNSFYNKMRIGDIVLSCYSASTIDAIGVVTGECEWHDEFPVHKRVRAVKWLIKGINENIVELNNDTTMTLSAIYKMKISASAVLDIVKRYQGEKEIDNSKQSKEKFVFIIDEINRGNISKIFGELITLIEETKRHGAVEVMEAILPYSREKFSVPDNVYILGTMNTADRSIALMDTALRRRFLFEEMMPESDVLRMIGADIVTAGEQRLDVATMLDIINKRIEYLYDREHTIGHAFFTRLKNSPTIDTLASIFKKSVIPLLQEYFYEDYSKIQLVLGDNAKIGDAKEYQFIRDDRLEANDIFIGSPEIDLPDNRYSIQDDAFMKIESYKLIGEGL